MSREFYAAYVAAFCIIAKFGVSVDTDIALQAEPMAETMAPQATYTLASYTVLLDLKTEETGAEGSWHPIEGKYEPLCLN